MASDTFNTSKPGPDPVKSRGFAASDAGSFNDIGKDIGAAYAAALTYLSAQVDRLKVAGRNLLLILILAVVAGTIGLLAVATATVLLVIGIAGFVGTLLGNRPWAGDLITGVMMVSFVLLASYVTIRKISKAARLKTMSSYQHKF